MRNYKLRNFLLVSDNESQTVKLVLQAPAEQPGNAPEIDEAFLSRREAIVKKYKAPHYGVITARAANLDSVREAFPELHGWQDIQVDELILPHSDNGSS